MRKVNMRGPREKPEDWGIGQLRVLRRVNKYEFAVELEVMREGMNRNRWNYRNMQDNYLTFLGTPILVAYVNGQVGDGHNMREKVNPRTGEVYQSFTDATSERIVGALSEDPADFSMVEKDGQTWLRAQGKLWSFYAPELVEKIVRTGRMEVSAETNVLEMSKDGEVEIFTKWEGLGVTILGEHVAPAIPGAQIAALAAMDKEFRQLKLRAAALANDQGNVEDPKPKNTSREGVKRTMNKRDITRLSPKFPGYKIVALSEDKMKVGLVDETGAPFSYTFNQEDGGEVIQSKLAPAVFSASLTFGEGESLTVELEDVVEYVSANNAKAAEKAARLEGELEKAKETIKTMEQAEHQRRVDAVKEAVKAALAEIEENAEEGEEGMEEEAKEIEENAEDYAQMEDSNAAFCGDKKARAALMARYSEKRLKVNKGKRKKVFAWDNIPGGHTGGEDGIDAMLGRING